jgi:hypothetical protein
MNAIDPPTEPFTPPFEPSDRQAGRPTCHRRRQLPSDLLRGPTSALMLSLHTGDR